MTQRRYKVRNSRWKTLTTLLYHKGLKRPSGDTVETTPSELTKLTGIGRTQLTGDNLQFLQDMGYISDVEYGYAHIKLKINMNLITAKQEQPAAPSVGSPSDSAVSGGHNNHSPSSCPECDSKNIRWEIKSFGDEGNCGDCRHIFISSEMIRHVLGKEMKYLGTDYRKYEGETACQGKQQEQEVESQKQHSEKSSTSSMSQPKLKSKLRLPSTSE